MSRTFDVILKIQHGVSCAMCMGSLDLWTFYVISEIRLVQGGPKKVYDFYKMSSSFVG